MYVNAMEYPLQIVQSTIRHFKKKCKETYNELKLAREFYNAAFVAQDVYTARYYDAKISEISYKYEYFMYQLIYWREIQDKKRFDYNWVVEK